MSAFRGFIRQGSFSSVIEPIFTDAGFSCPICVIPNSFQYNLGDLLSTGVKLSPTDTSLLHDDNAIDKVISNSDSSK